jgi:hypothetical protein
MGKKITTIFAILLFIISIVSVLLLGTHFDLFNHPNKTYIVMAFVIPLVQLSLVFVSIFKK